MLRGLLHEELRARSVDRFGVRDSRERWDARGRPDIVDDARRAVDETLAAHRPLPLDEVIAQLDRAGRLQAAA